MKSDYGAVHDFTSFCCFILKKAPYRFTEAKEIVDAALERVQPGTHYISVNGFLLQRTLPLGAHPDWSDLLLDVTMVDDVGGVIDKKVINGLCIYNHVLKHNNREIFIDVGNCLGSQWTSR